MDGMLSFKEITRMVFANFEYRHKEREAGFQNLSDRPCIRL
jgi:hypothetical protein